jgi:translation initiation factor IF-2
LATVESSWQQKEQQQQEKQQAITKDAEKIRTMIKATFHETAVSNISKSDLLSQVGCVTSKAKVTTVEENNELAREGLNKQARQTLPQPMSDIITSYSGVETNKQTDRSWINKIKKATDVENWRSWQ